MSVDIIDHIDKNINMSVYTCTFSCSPALPSSIQRTLKMLIFGLPQTSSTPMKNILKQTYSLLYFQVILLVKQQASKFLREVAANCEKQTQSLSSSHCPLTIWQPVKSLSASLPSFKPPLWFGYCVAVLISSPLTKTKRQQRTAWMVPRSRVRLYTKQHAHKIGPVLYCDGRARCVIHKYGGVLAGLQKKIYDSDAETSHRYVMFVCLLVCCSPVAPAGPARWRWISCCYFLIQQSSPVSWK